MDRSVYQVYEDEIQLLEAEIKLLSEKYEDIQQESTFFSDEEVQMSVKLFQGEFLGELKGHTSPWDLKAELESLERDLSFLVKFTGIQITSHSKKTLEKTANRTVQKHRLSGNCQSLPFCLEFQLLEVQNNKNVSAAVTDLRILMESGPYSELSKFVSSIEEHGNLLMFFRSFSSYAEWCKHRRCTFLHFKAKYPNIVILPEGQEGDHIILRNRQLPGFELMIVWKMLISEEGTTTPVLDLLPKVPEQVGEQKKAAIDNAPTCFRSMLLLFGIETAIENLIQAFSLEK
ncbi:centromere protein P [Lagopus leucura]|uniref:centromere protein P n=1 Tax=Lagopus leucura TaxID=30410 RepID=UPI001C66C908|nr:centromere protein P [Lagopus leucura]XP_042736028.1 centromere protein P [Lagopus leucura]